MVVSLVSGEGRPLVAVHGFGLDHRSLLPLEQMLEGEPWRRIYVDLPWTPAAAGLSTASTADEVAAELVGEIDAHLDGEPFAVIGHSFGGMLARHVAHERRHQILGLATLAGVVEPTHAHRTLPPRTVLHRDGTVLAAADDTRAAFEEGSVIQDATTYQAFLAYILPGIQESDTTVMDRIAANYALAQVPETAHPDPFTAPSLHVFGRQDDVVGFEDGLRLRDHYPRGSFAILDAAGHSLHLEQPQTTGALIRDWLHRIDHSPQTQDQIGRTALNLATTSKSQ